MIPCNDCHLELYQDSFDSQIMYAINNQTMLNIWRFPDQPFRDKGKETYNSFSLDIGENNEILDFRVT